MKINFPEPSSLTLKARINLFLLTGKQRCPQCDLWSRWQTQNAFAWGLQRSSKHINCYSFLSEDRSRELWVRLLCFHFTAAISGPNPPHQVLFQAGWRDQNHFQLQFSTFYNVIGACRGNKQTKNKQQQNPKRERGCLSMIYKDGGIYTNRRN